MTVECKYSRKSGDTFLCDFDGLICDDTLRSVCCIFKPKGGSSEEKSKDKTNNSKS